MLASVSIFRPLTCLRSPLQKQHAISTPSRSLATAASRYRTLPPILPPGQDLSLIPKAPYKIKVHPAPRAARKICPEPLKTFTATQLSTLDPTGSRTRLFSRTDPDAAQPGDVLIVRFRSGEPFAGVILSIRRRGVDSAVLLRNRLSRVGTEVWVKVHSPLVAGMEIVERAERRARRARLFYMRQKKHDRGSLERMVENYIRRRREMGRGPLSGSSSTGKSGNVETKR